MTAARLFSAIGLILLALASCAPNLRALTKQAGSLGVACNQAASRFAAVPTTDARQEVLSRLKELNEALIQTAGYEQDARSANSVELIDANRAFLETGRAWATCSLRYNGTLVATGEREAAQRNYQGVLVRLSGPQFVAERRLVQAALNELGPAPSAP